MNPGTSPADAVSPVVGVMLMLAVTVMIAAIVSTYAGGFSGNAEKSPQSSLRAMADLNLHRIYFEHDGGDPFMLSSITIVLRKNDDKISLALPDAGHGKVSRFEEVGTSVPGNDTTIMAGDTFFIEGESSDSGSAMKFGTMVLNNNTKITWLVIDRESGKSVSTGSLYLQ